LIGHKFDPENELLRGMAVKPSWVTKTDPVKYPVRFLGSLWQKQMGAKFSTAERPLTSKEYGQLKALRLHVGDLTQALIEWVVDPLNWWQFCQAVRAGWKTIFVPEYPDIGFLLGRRGVALRVMRSKVTGTPEGAEFVKKLDEKEYHGIKSLLLAAYTRGNPERLATIEAAKTLSEIQQVFNAIVGDSKADSTNDGES
jgi:hypothetical protein